MSSWRPGSDGAGRGRLTRNPRGREALDALDNLACLLLVKAVRAFSEIPADKTPPFVATQMAKVAAEISDSAWNGAMDLDQTTAQETLPADGYDVLDSLRADPDVAPLLVRLQEMGVELEPGADTDTEELAG